MYLISAYFDEHVTKGLQRLIDNIAKETGNTYMIENNVPPHLTISSFETRKPDNLKEEFMSTAPLFGKSEVSDFFFRYSLSHGFPHDRNNLRSPDVPAGLCHKAFHYPQRHNHTS